MKFSCRVTLNNCKTVQDVRSTNALQALKQYTEPEVTVIRDGIEKNIRVEDLVPGDVRYM